jgi:hypothetical protein
MKTKGKFIFKKQFYSYCSMHFDEDKDCFACQHGQWSNIILDKIGHFIFKHFPKLWIWYVNKF